MRVLAFDLDGTLLTKNSSFAFCHFLCRQKHLSYVQLIYSALWYGYYRHWSHSYYHLHKRIFDHLLRGQNLNFLKTQAERFVEKHLKGMLYPPAFRRLEEQKKGQGRAVILSCSPDFLVKPIANFLGVDETISSVYTTDNDGCLLDIAKVIDGKAKADYMHRYASDETVAYSDSFDDLPFLEKASRAIAVRPDRKLRRFARKNKWEML